MAENHALFLDGLDTLDASLQHEVEGAVVGLVELLREQLVTPIMQLGRPGQRREEVFDVLVEHLVDLAVLDEEAQLVALGGVQDALLVGVTRDQGPVAGQFGDVEDSAHDVSFTLSDFFRDLRLISRLTLAPGTDSFC